MLSCLVAGCVLFACCTLTAGEAPNTLAVLNFTNRNPGDGWDWLGTGLADMLITDLSRSAAFQLVSRERMVALAREMSFGRTGLPAEAGLRGLSRAARARYVLGGTFQVKGTVLSLYAHLFDAETGKLKRVHAVSGKSGELFALEKALAKQIIERFAVKLTAAERALLEYMPTDSLDAAAHCYRGLKLQDEGKLYDALRHLRRSVARDPRFGRGGWHLARLYYYLAELEHARLEYRRLGRLPDDTPEALLGLQVYVHLPGSADERLAACREIMRRWPRRRQVNRTPPLAMGASSAAQLLAMSGRVDEALRLLQNTRIKPADDFFNWGRSAVRHTYVHILDLSGQTAAGAPLGSQYMVRLTRERPSVSSGGRQAKPPPGMKASCGWGRAYHLQAEDGYWLRSLRLTAVVSGPAESARFSVRRLGSAARGAYGSDLPLHKAFNRAPGDQQTLDTVWRLAPGMRGVRFFAGGRPWKKGRVHSWTLTADLAPLGETGSLRVRCWPPGRVWIDGHPAGTTADDFPCVPAGRHNVLVQARPPSLQPTRAEDCRAQVIVRPGRETAATLHPYGAAFDARWDERVRVEPPGGLMGLSGIGVHPGSFRMLAADDGRLHVIASAAVWARYVDGKIRSARDLYYARHEPGSRRLRFRPLPPPISGGYVIDHSVAWEPDGSLLLVYQQSGGGVFLSRTRDFIRWTRPTRVPTARGQPQVVIAGAKRYVLFTTTWARGGPDGIQVQRSADGGATWSVPATVATWRAGSGRASPCRAVAYSNGTFWAAVATREGVWVWSSRDLKAWTRHPLPPGKGPAVHLWPEPNGGCALGFEAKGKDFLVMTTRDGTAWTKRLLSPFDRTCRVARAPDGSWWVAGVTYSGVWIRRRKPSAVGLPPVTERGEGE